MGSTFTESSVTPWKPSSKVLNGKHVEFLLLVFHLLVKITETEREGRGTCSQKERVSAEERQGKGKEDAMESGKGMKKEERMREGTGGERVKEAS